MFLSDITAVIAVKNRHINITYCIASIEQRKDFPNCIVVDFGSEPRLHFFERPWLTVIRVDNNVSKFHKARALNIGLRSVITEFVVFTDADQIFAPNFFTTIWGYLPSDPALLLRCYTHFLEHIPPKISPSTVMNHYDSLLTDAKKNPKFLGEGCCVGCLTNNALKLNGFDEQYHGWGYEDCDFAYRMLLSGCVSLFVHDKTTLIHLPHQENWIGRIENNDLYKRCQMTQEAVVNENINWGAL